MAVNPHLRRPWRYVPPFCLILLGIAVFSYSFCRSLPTLDAGLEQMVAPGFSAFDLPTPGRQMIFYEYETVFRGIVYHRHETPPQMTLRIVNLATGAEIEATEVPPKERFSFGNRHGLSMWTFDTELPGKYQVTVTMPPRMPFPRVVLAVGQRQTPAQMAAELLRKLLPALLVLTVCIAVGIVSLCRERRKNEAAA